MRGQIPHLCHTFRVTLALRNFELRLTKC
jgi:hypothetical protein